MLFIPTNRGIGLVDQLVVPVATPPDTGVSHRTTETPTLSVAVPLMVIAESEVKKDVVDGIRMAIVGGVVSVDPPAPGKAVTVM